MLKSYQGSELYMKAENFLKYEYALMQEHTKVMILKQYMEGELSKLDQDRNELLKEREKYLLLYEKERQIEEERKHIEC